MTLLIKQNTPKPKSKTKCPTGVDSALWLYWAFLWTQSQRSPNGHYEQFLETAARLFGRHYSAISRWNDALVAQGAAEYVRENQKDPKTGQKLPNILRPKRPSEHIFSL